MHRKWVIKIIQIHTQSYKNSRACNKIPMLGITKEHVLRLCFTLYHKILLVHNLINIGYKCRPSQIHQNPHYQIKQAIILLLARKANTHKEIGQYTINENSIKMAS